MGRRVILSSFFAALGQIADPRFRRVVLLGLALTVALLVGATSGFLWLIDWLLADSFSVPLLGEITWVDNVLSLGATALFFGLSTFLMIPVAAAIISMFLDQVAAAVEERHYPHLPPASPVPFGDALVDMVNFLGVLVAANIVALLLYLLFLPSALFIFWGLNGYLLGREYFMLVAMRRVGRAQAKVLWRAHSGTVWLAGVLMAMPLSIPLINLVIPVIGAATFTHLFHRLTADQGPGQTSPYRSD